MILYFPFSHLSEDLIHRITSAVGPVAVCQVAETLVPAHMQACAQHRLVSILIPGVLDKERLRQAVKEFMDWGGLHEGHLSAVASLYTADSTRLPEVDDQTSTRISDMIRHYGDDHSSATPDEFFRAALFTALAQIHDEQQEAVNSNMTLVQLQEKEMIAGLTGDSADARRDTFRTDPLLSNQGQVPALGTDPGLVLTEQRIEAWARLAGRLDMTVQLYLTSSRAVYDALLDQFPEAVRVGRWELSGFRPGDTGSVDIEIDRINSALEKLAAADDPSSVALELGDPAFDGTATAVLTIHALTGLDSRKVLDRLGKAEDKETSRAAEGTIGSNALIGYLELTGYQKTSVR